MKKETTPKVLLIAVLIFLTVLGRLVTNYLEIYNFTAIGAGALFSGVVFKDKRYAYLVPLAAVFLSDVFFELFTNIQGFYGGGEQLFVYGAFILTTFIGTRIKKAHAGNILLASIGVGVMFFLLSNLGTFLFRDLYPRTFSGLMTCYLSAIPFYKNSLFGSFALNTVLGNVFYSGGLFGAYALLKPVFVKQQEQQLA